MSLFDFIKDELKIASIANINSPKNKDLRYSYVSRAISHAIEVTPVEHYKNGKPKPYQSTILKRVREETGLKFSNSVGRKEFNRKKLIEPSTDYAKKLRDNAKPNLENVPLTKKAKQDKNYIIKDELLYIYDIYVRTYSNKKIKHKKNYKLKNLPKKAIRLSSGEFMTKEPFVFYSDVRLSKDEANAIIYKIFTGRGSDLQSIQKYINVSDVGNVFDKSKIRVGFKLSAIVRN